MENSSRKKFIYLPIMFAIVFVAGMFLGVKLLRFSNGTGNTIKDFFSPNLNNYNKLNDVINYIETSYVDTVNHDKLIEFAINGILQNLDPHSAYIPAADFNDVNDPLMGKFDGIGVEFRILKDTVIVINTIPGGPSEQRGVKAGDRIIKVEGKSIAGIKITNELVMKKLKGKKGTEVNITVFRPGLPKLFEFKIIRAPIPTYSIDVSYMVTNNIGCIKLSKFSKTTSEEFSNALLTLKSKGMTKLILDLRGNGGGFLDAAIDLSDEFLSNGKLIVYTEGLHRSKKSSFATGSGSFENGELVILIDENSASASEIVSGAIQDNDRGIIIGRRSFGKGLVQEQVDLIDGSAIRLTVARYHTPTGRCIQKSYKNGSDEYYNDFAHRFTDGEMLNADSIPLADSLKFKTPKGKIVYGGGGIMPDIFVPIDTAQNTKYFIQLYNKGIIYQFGFDYADSHRQQIKATYKNAENFNKSFMVSEAIFEGLIKSGEKNGVKRNDKAIKASTVIIKTELKAAIGKNIYGNEALYPLLNNTDNTFLKAIEVLKKR